MERLKAYTENIIESINLAVLALDQDGRITSCNRAFEELYGATRQQIVGLAGGKAFPAGCDRIHPRNRESRDGNLRSPANIFKLSLENRKGQRLIVNLSLIPLQAPARDNTGSLIMMDDITEKVQLEDQLLQAEKLSSIGLLAAGIAHEVNTPITGISSYTQMLLKETPETDRRKPILEKIEKQTFRAAEIVNGLLNFSRLNGSEFKELDINQLIDESLALLNHQLADQQHQGGIPIRMSLPPVYRKHGQASAGFRQPVPECAGCHALRRRDCSSDGNE